MLTRSTRSWLGLVLALALAGGANAGDLYDLDTGREVAIATTAAALGTWLWWDSADVTGPDAETLAGLDVQAVPAFDRIATRWWSPTAGRWSDVTMFAAGLMPLALLAETGDDLAAGELAVMYLQTMALQQTVVGVLKVQAGRLRPFTYNQDPRIPEDLQRSAYARRSFPSGHTATAFAGAVFTSEVYARLNPRRDSRHWVRAGAWSLAALTGYLRVRAGNHFPSDVLAGAAIGAALGWAVPALHETDRDPLAPDLPQAGLGPHVHLGFSF